MGQTAEQISAFRNERDFEEGIRFAERALQKYPNSFDVVYESALLYNVAMFRHRGQNVRRTIELLERSIALIDQNTREGVCAVTIQNKIANCYCYLDDMAKAVEVLKQNKNEPLRVGCQVAIVYAVINGFLNNVPVKGVKEYERRLYEKLERSHTDLLERFEAGYYEAEDVEALRTILHDMNG